MPAVPSADPGTFGVDTAPVLRSEESAAVIGLFPDCNLEKVHAVGNAVGDGARMALLNIDKRKEADIMARKVEYIELTVAPEFNNTFTKAMTFPHAEDKFPNLEHLFKKQRI